MSIPGIAPTFVLSFAGPPDEAVRRLEALSRDEARGFTGRIAGRHLTLTVHERDRHFWSPWLHLEVTDHEGEARVRGRFTPHPSLWTGFAFSYFSLLVLALFAGVWGASQWMLETPPTALWGALGCCVLVGLLWWAAQIGQTLAREQMHTLRDAVEAAMA